MRLPLPPPPPPRRLSRRLAGERACRFCERYRPSRRFFFLRVCFFLPTQLPPWTACAWTPPQVPLLRAAPISRKRASERHPTGLFTLVYAWCPHEGDEECPTTLTCVRRGARVISNGNAPGIRSKAGFDDRNAVLIVEWLLYYPDACARVARSKRSPQERHLSRKFALDVLQSPFPRCRGPRSWPDRSTLLRGAVAKCVKCR